MKKVIIPLMIAAVVIAMFGLFKATESSADHNAIIYKTSFCGCCEFHAKYLQSNFNVETEDLSQSELDQMRENTAYRLKFKAATPLLLKNTLLKAICPNRP